MMQRLDYDIFLEEAKRDVIRRAFSSVAKHGLPGEHHICLTFRVNETGVEMPCSLREHWPEEMTIVIQHQYWDFVVEGAFFSITLSFSQKLERITVPFTAIVSFIDHDANFTMNFSSCKTRPLSTTELSEETVHGQAAKFGKKKSGPCDNKKPGTATLSTVVNTDTTDTEKVVTLDDFRRK